MSYLIGDHVITIQGLIYDHGVRVFIDKVVLERDHPFGHVRFRDEDENQYVTKNVLVKTIMGEHIEALKQDPTPLMAEFVLEHD